MIPLLTLGELYLIPSSVTAVDEACREVAPCFMQIDLAVRKSLHPSTHGGNPPPFIVVQTYHSEEKHTIKGQILFTRESAIPPPSIMTMWPTRCGTPACKEPDCATLALPSDGKESAWLLDSDGELVVSHLLGLLIFVSLHYLWN